MSILNENISLKIKNVSHMSWDASSVSVAPRPYHALVLRICGSAGFSSEKCEAQTEAGDVFYMPSNYAYDAVYPEKNEIVAIHFESDISADMENFKPANPHRITVIFNRILEIWEQKKAGYYYSAMSLMNEMLEYITVQALPAVSNKTIESFEKAVAYMEENYTDSSFSISRMVERSYISNTYFCKLFCGRFGTTPIKYLTAKRLAHAEKLLVSGEYSVGEVAEMSGFGDVKYFSRVVKKEYGVPPSRLYIRHRNGD